MKGAKLTPSVRRAIVRRIRDQPIHERLTWRQVEAFAGTLCVGGATRQWLSQDPEIANAYHQKNEARRTGTAGVARPGGALARAQQRIDHLKSRVQQLEMALGEYDQTLAKLMVNARNAGMTQEQIMTPLGPNGRRRANPVAASRKSNC